MVLFRGFKSMEKQRAPDGQVSEKSLVSGRL
jgi:hypothetical protein